MTVSLLTRVRQALNRKRACRDLRHAVRAGEVEDVLDALARGGDPNQDVDWDWQALDANEHPTLLLWACAEGSLEVARALLSAGAERQVADAPWERNLAHFVAHRASDPGAMDLLVHLHTIEPTLFVQRSRLGLKGGLTPASGVLPEQELEAHQRTEFRDRLRALHDQGHLATQLPPAPPPRTPRSRL